MGWRLQDALCSVAEDITIAPESFKTAFIEHLARFQVIRFGDFTLKSGRKSPYFINAGQLRTGQAIAGLGVAYAACIRAQHLDCDMVFGPSYKGVPLAVSTAMALSDEDADIGFGFDRKETKDHGEGGTFVGTTPAAGMRVVVVDDVITSGTSIRQSVALLHQTADVLVSGVVVAVDRQERGVGEKSTLRELQEDLGLSVHPIVTIREVVSYLTSHQVDGQVLLSEQQLAAVERYLGEHTAGDA